MDLYVNLTYEDYKRLERQAREFKETAHGEGTEYYHKAFVLDIGGVRFEFHGPNVKARQTAFATKDSAGDESDSEQAPHIFSPSDRCSACFAAAEGETILVCGLIGEHPEHSWEPYALMRRSL